MTEFYDPERASKFRFDGDVMTIDETAIQSGEFRTFSDRGEKIIYVGGTWEANNIDLSEADLVTGEVRRLTDAPGYVDPVDVSHDGQWLIIEDTRMYDRTFYIDAMRHIPPIIDTIVSGAAASIRNDGQRRYFQPVLLDKYGDRGDYQGQQINLEGDGSNGAVNDPNWNALADPKFSWDDTKIVYHQGLVIDPASTGHRFQRVWTQILHGTNLEALGAQPVPPEERTERQTINIFTIWFALSTNMLPCVLIQPVYP